MSDNELILTMKCQGDNFQCNSIQSGSMQGHMDEEDTCWFVQSTDGSDGDTL